ncbi:PriCT-2 domain-containing protein [Thiomicrorhabdus cannonii]|uniref:PriCT-2 domain-containing protein n=1 Tax=Thiomicrorhabdus cannonii TaxID=2748011 RepID=UPI0024833C71|nr:PriCT-2 domain-containing protein [Thiomicrorhabdus cannonii]
MLTYIPADTDRGEWVAVLMAIKSEFGDGARETAREWSATAATYRPADFNDTWRSIKAGGGVTIGTLVSKAKANGFRFQPISQHERQRLTMAQQQRKTQQAAALAIEAQRLAANYQRASEQAYRILGSAQPAPANHPYLIRKQIDAHGVLYGTVWSYEDALIIPMAGTQPPFAGVVQSLQFIQPDGTKRYLKGAKKDGGYYPIQWVEDAPIVICEGFATGATLAQHYTPFSSVVCAFDAGNLLAVARFFRKQYPAAQIIIAGDNDHHTERTTGRNPGKDKATAAARAVGAEISLPYFAETEAGTDWNDRYLIDQNKLENMEHNALYTERLGGEA